MSTQSTTYAPVQQLHDREPQHDVEAQRPARDNDGNKIVFLDQQHSDKYPAETETPDTYKEAAEEGPPEDKKNSGLSKTQIWAIIIIILVVAAAAIGGGVGKSLSKKKSKRLVKV